VLCEDVVIVGGSMESVCDCRVWGVVRILFRAIVLCYFDFPSCGVEGDFGSRQWLLFNRVGPYNVELGFGQ